MRSAAGHVLGQQRGHICAGVADQDFFLVLDRLFRKPPGGPRGRPENGPRASTAGTDGGGWVGPSLIRIHLTGRGATSNWPPASYGLGQFPGLAGRQSPGIVGAARWRPKARRADRRRCGSLRRTRRRSTGQHAKQPVASRANSAAHSPGSTSRRPVLPAKDHRHAGLADRTPRQSASWSCWSRCCIHSPTPTHALDAA